RGRLVSALRARPVPLTEVAHLAGWPDDPLRAERVLEGLVTDGLARVEGDHIHLP
ncbi:MAG: A/G-specific adenine glycosylase, partial [Actinomycetota bacterium]|nr:A/G-specific adenine glycosylase [Actinomycetota bacterium]